jgi:hypothetical protein
MFGNSLSWRCLLETAVSADDRFDFERVEAAAGGA